MNKLLGVAAALCSLTLSPTVEAQDATSDGPGIPAPKDPDRHVAFDEWHGDWHVAGDPELGACMLLGSTSTYNGTTMTVAAVAAQDVYQFALRNPAWNSLADGAMRLKATFHDSSGKITDLWDLDTVTASSDNGGPRINWAIDRARNDAASFVGEMAGASELWFFNGTVPVAKFKLSGSAKALAALDRCRAQIRIDPSFDPFASD